MSDEKVTITEIHRDKEMSVWIDPTDTQAKTEATRAMNSSCVPSQWDVSIQIYNFRQQTELSTERNIAYEYVAITSELRTPGESCNPLEGAKRVRITKPSVDIYQKWQGQDRKVYKTMPVYAVTVRVGNQEATHIIKLNGGQEIQWLQVTVLDGKIV